MAAIAFHLIAQTHQLLLLGLDLVTDWFLLSLKQFVNVRQQLFALRTFFHARQLLLHLLKFVDTGNNSFLNRFSHIPSAQFLERLVHVVGGLQNLGARQGRLSLGRTQMRGFFQCRLYILRTQLGQANLVVFVRRFLRLTLYLQCLKQTVVCVVFDFFLTLSFQRVAL